VRFSKPQILTLDITLKVHRPNAYFNPEPKHCHWTRHGNR